MTDEEDNLETEEEAGKFSESDEDQDKFFRDMDEQFSHFMSSHKAKLDDQRRQKVVARSKQRKQKAKSKSSFKAIQDKD